MHALFVSIIILVCQFSCSISEKGKLEPVIVNPSVVLATGLINQASGVDDHRNVTFELVADKNCFKPIRFSDLSIKIFLFGKQIDSVSDFSQVRFSRTLDLEQGKKYTFELYSFALNMSIAQVVTNLGKNESIVFTFPC